MANCRRCARPLNWISNLDGTIELEECRCKEVKTYQSSVLPTPVIEKPVWHCPACGHVELMDLGFCVQCYRTSQRRKKNPSDKYLYAPVSPGIRYYNNPKPEVSTKKIATICQVCGVRVVKLQRHMKKVHNNQTANSDEKKGNEAFALKQGSQKETNQKEKNKEQNDTSQRRQIDSLTICSKCQLFVMSSIYSSHFEKCQGIEKIKNFGKENYKCIDCNNIIPFRKQLRHALKCPLPEPLNQQPKTKQPQKTIVSQTKNNKVICPHCQSPIKEMNIEIHVKNCRLANNSSKSEIKKQQGKTQYTNNEEVSFDERRHGPSSRPGSYQDLGYDDRMDATRGQGFRAREHGRFGSHPIHDNYDD